MKKWSRTDWLLVVAIGALVALLVRGGLQKHGFSFPTFGMGVGEVLVIGLVAVVVFGASKLR